jgi:hypothetical protein
LYFSGYQQNMSAPYGGNQGGFGAGAGNMYNQGGYPQGQGGGYNPGGYPPSGQQPYGANPYGQNFGAPGSGYPPPQGGGDYRPPQGGGYGPNPGNFMSNDQRSQRLTQVIQQYEINQQFAARLQALGNCEIVLLCDDSGSMNTPLVGTNQTRWDELKSVCFIHQLFLYNYSY